MVKTKKIIKSRLNKHLEEQARLIKEFNKPDTLMYVRKAIYSQYKNISHAIKVLSGKLEKLTNEAASVQS